MPTVAALGRRIQVPPHLSPFYGVNLSGDAMDREVEVLLYGATGYTGRLIAGALRERGVSFQVAGRDAKRLEGLVRDLGLEAPPVVVGLDDAVGLERAARSARVVMSAAGPFTELGPPVMDAALEAGAHFVDITGEQAYLRWAFEQDARARDAGVTVVNAMGFDVVPTDVAALLSVTAMREVVSVDIALRSRARFSGGTLRSMAASVGNGWAYREGRFRRAPPGRWVRPFPFPEPTGTREGVFVPWGDVVTAPRTTRARSVRTFFVSSRAGAMHRMWPLTALAWNTGLARPFLRRRARANRDPSDEERRASRFECLAEAVDEDGVVQRGYVSGRDPYGLTGALAAYAGAALARDPAPRGVLTPTQAFRFGPLFEAMQERYELTWRARSLD